jgi:hypothetical protein
MASGILNRKTTSIRFIVTIIIHQKLLQFDEIFAPIQKKKFKKIINVIKLPAMGAKRIPNSKICLKFQNVPQNLKKLKNFLKVI